MYLVGAGPGDPGLISVKGANLLERADVVVHDYLANPRLLGYCPRAEMIDVGKKAGDHTLSQEQINALLVEKARSGKRVVRLKGGDPFVFGRGGEECQALAAAGIAFEVVPGITAAIAAAAYAGIPVTHRDLNSSFTLITGHEKEGQTASDLDWAAIAKLPCIALYMGAASLPKIARTLIEHGMSAQTPTACIRWGTLPTQQTLVSTLGDLSQAIMTPKPPIMTIIGKVVALRQNISWFEKRPLFGQKILVTRTRQQASELSQRLEELGAMVIEAPTIEIAPAANEAAVDEAILSAGLYDWTIFTSANGVQQTRERLMARGADSRVFGKSKIAAIGDATATAIERELCLRVDLCPAAFVAEALADELQKRGEISGRKFLLLRADIARPLLRERLTEAGAAAVDDVALYQTRSAQSLPAGALEELQGGNIRWITFASGSAARNLIGLIGADYQAILGRAKLASIGPITTQALREAGLKPSAQAGVYNVQGLVDAIAGASEHPS